MLLLLLYFREFNQNKFKFLVSNQKSLSTEYLLVQILNFALIIKFHHPPQFLLSDLVLSFPFPVLNFHFSCWITFCAHTFFSLPISYRFNIKLNNIFTQRKLLDLQGWMNINQSQQEIIDQMLTQGTEKNLQNVGPDVYADCGNQ